MTFGIGAAGVRPTVEPDGDGGKKTAQEAARPTGACRGGWGISRPARSSSARCGELRVVGLARVLRQQPALRRPRFPLVAQDGEVGLAEEGPDARAGAAAARAQSEGRHDPQGGHEPKLSMGGGGRRERDDGFYGGSIRSPCEQSTSRNNASGATPGRESGAHIKASRRGRGNPVRHQSILEYALFAVPGRPGARRAKPERSTSGTSPPQALRRHLAGLHPGTMGAPLSPARWCGVRNAASLAAGSLQGWLSAHVYLGPRSWWWPRCKRDSSWGGTCTRSPTC